MTADRRPSPSIIAEVVALWAIDPNVPFDLVGCTCVPWLFVSACEVEIAHDEDCLRLRSLRGAA